METAGTAKRFSSIRTKCTVMNTTKNPQGGLSVQLRTEWDPASKDQQLMQNAQGNPTITIEVTNPEAVNFFTPNENYYLEFTKL
jgi:hypothetical protein